MPLPDVPQTLKVELFQRLDNQNIENVMSFRHNTGWDEPTANGFLVDLVEWWGSEMAVIISDRLTLVGLKGTDISSSNGFTTEYQPVTPVPGLVNADPLPNNNALVISFRTAFRGRSYRGRNYIAGIPESSTTLSSASGAFVTGLLTAYNALTAVAAANDCEHVVVSLYENGAERATGIATPVTAYVIVDAVIDSQRRRSPGRGS